jgi:hypothetical protein
MIQIRLISFLPFFFILIIINNISAQVIKENWESIKSINKERIYVNTVNLDRNIGDDIYVWVMEEHSPPEAMEGIDADIYRTKTYFLLNKRIKRYSILQIIFYDAKGNVLKNYNYTRNMENESYKYSSPILEGSNIEAVLLLCVQHIKSK